MRELNILSRTEVGSNLYHAYTKNHQGGLEDFEDESDAKKFSVPDLRNWPAISSTYPARTNSKADTASFKGTLIKFLSKIILTVTTSVTWRSKFSAVFLHHLDDSNLNAFQTF